MNSFSIIVPQLKKLLQVVLVFSFITSVLSAQQSTQLLNNSVDNVQPPDYKKIIIDSDYTLEEALQGITIPASIKNKLDLVTVNYYGYDGFLHQGQMIVDIAIKEDITEIFELIEEIKFPVEKVIPITEYDWSDDKSMLGNNTSSFNYRFVSGSKILSMHARGMAIDINPKQNPYVKNGNSSPAGSNYEINTDGTISPESQLVKAFKKRGWTWGGDWKNLKDYQHFEKKLK
jgi:peptidoglycan LD-endopeptidase CwlK